MSESNGDTHPFHFALLIVGGLLLGFGVIGLYSSFGWPGGGFNSSFEQIGFSGLDDISLLPSWTFSIPAVVIGAVCLILANATAWKETDGY